MSLRSGDLDLQLGGPKFNLQQNKQANKIEILNCLCTFRV